MNTKEIVEAVRNHPEIGRGSCHPWDECLSDIELAELIEQFDNPTVESVIETGLGVLDVWSDRMGEAF